MLDLTELCFDFIIVLSTCDGLVDDRRQFKCAFIPGLIAEALFLKPRCAGVAASTPVANVLAFQVKITSAVAVECL